LTTQARAGIVLAVGKQTISAQEASGIVSTGRPVPLRSDRSSLGDLRSCCWSLGDTGQGILGDALPVLPDSQDSRFDCKGARAAQEADELRSPADLECYQRRWLRDHRGVCVFNTSETRSALRLPPRVLILTPGCTEHIGLRPTIALKAVVSMSLAWELFHD